MSLSKFVSVFPILATFQGDHMVDSIYLYSLFFDYRGKIAWQGLGLGVVAIEYWF